MKTPCSASALILLLTSMPALAEPSMNRLLREHCEANRLQVTDSIGKRVAEFQNVAQKVAARLPHDLLAAIPQLNSRAIRAGRAMKELEARLKAAPTPEARALLKEQHRRTLQNYYTTRAEKAELISALSSAPAVVAAIAELRERNMELAIEEPSPDEVTVALHDGETPAVSTLTADPATIKVELASLQDWRQKLAKECQPLSDPAAKPSNAPAGGG